MDFKYDFDMFSVIPEEVRAEFQGMFDEIGMGAAAGEQVALFRDPALVEALASAEDKVKDLFLNAGFGLNVYDSGAPEGRYPGHDEDARNNCVRRLADNIAATDGLKDANWGGFNVDDFLIHLSLAQPIDQVEMQQNTDVKISHQKKKSVTRMGLVAGGAMIMASTVGIALATIG